MVRTPAKGLRSFSPAVGPPLLIPLYFQYQIIMTMIVRKDWVVSPGVHLARGRGEEGVRVNGPRRPGLCPTYLCGASAVVALSLSGRSLLGGCQDPGGHCTPLLKITLMGSTGEPLPLQNPPQKIPEGNVMRAKLGPHIRSSAPAITLLCPPCGP